MRAAEYRIRALPVWNGAISIEPLKGGLSNESFLVVDSNGKHVVRFGKDFPFHHVFRQREIMAARAASAAGFAPEVQFAEPGVMVSAFLGAKTFGANDVRENRVRIAKLVRAFHEEMPKHVSGAGFMFWVFHVIRDYARTLEAGGSRMRRSCRSIWRSTMRWKQCSSRCRSSLATTICCRRIFSTTARDSG